MVVAVDLVTGDKFALLTKSEIADNIGIGNITVGR